MRGVHVSVSEPGMVGRVPWCNLAYSHVALILLGTRRGLVGVACMILSIQSLLLKSLVHGFPF